MKNPEIRDYEDIDDWSMDFNHWENNMQYRSSFWKKLIHRLFCLN